jgi:site-specific DNA-cytosine methylase
MKALNAILKPREYKLCNKPIFTVSSLFAAIGCIDLALYKTGFKIKWVNEIEKKACETYKRNFNHDIICKAILRVYSKLFSWVKKLINVKLSKIYKNQKYKI